MSDLMDALTRLESELRSLIDRTPAAGEPELQRIDILLVRIGMRMGGNAGGAAIAALDDAADEVRALPGAGSFDAVLTRAEAAVAAVSPAS